MKNDPIRTKVLSIRLIPNADRFLLKAMQVQEGHRSLGLITTDCDDVSYAALDEATKKADVSVAYARSMYAGSSNASTALAGEFIGILSGENPEDVKSGLAAAVSYIENDACFYSANNDDSIVYFAQCISRTGSYLSEMAGVPEGTAMAYLIAPPLEAVTGLDAALKAAVSRCCWRLSYWFPSGGDRELEFQNGLLCGRISHLHRGYGGKADLRFSLPLWTDPGFVK